MAGCVVVRAIPILVVLLCAVMLSACGKKGPPDPPGPPDQVTWPRAYPTR
jgi:predicted small lipoprotein YifL